MWPESEAPARRGRRKATARVEAAAAAPPMKAIGDGEGRRVDLARLPCFFLFSRGRRPEAEGGCQGTGKGFEKAITGKGAPKTGVGVLAEKMAHSQVFQIFTIHTHTYTPRTEHRQPPYALATQRTLCALPS